MSLLLFPRLFRGCIYQTSFIDDQPVGIRSTQDTQQIRLCFPQCPSRTMLSAWFSFSLNLNRLLLRKFGWVRPRKTKKIRVLHRREDISPSTQPSAVYKLCCCVVFSSRWDRVQSEAIHCDEKVCYPFPNAEALCSCAVLCVRTLRLILAPDVLLTLPGLIAPICPHWRVITMTPRSPFFIMGCGRCCDCTCE